MSSPAANRLLRLPQVLERTGLSRSMVYLLESQGRFPGRVKVGVRAVAWPEDEVQTWIDTKKASRRVTTDEESAQTVGRALASWGVHAEVIGGSENAKPVSTHRSVREDSNPTTDRGPHSAAQMLATPATRAPRAAK
jgi:prophage regulatory protein